MPCSETRWHHLDRRASLRGIVAFRCPRAPGEGRSLSPILRVPSTCPLVDILKNCLEADQCRPALMSPTRPISTQPTPAASKRLPPATPLTFSHGALPLRLGIL